MKANEGLRTLVFSSERRSYARKQLIRRNQMTSTWPNHTKPSYSRKKIWARHGLRRRTLQHLILDKGSRVEASVTAFWEGRRTKQIAKALSSKFKWAWRERHCPYQEKICKTWSEKGKRDQHSWRWAHERRLRRRRNLICSSNIPGYGKGKDVPPWRTSLETMILFGSELWGARRDG